MKPISSFSQSGEICAICIGKFDEKIRHCGILYKLEESGQSFFIHLANPLQTRNDPEQVFLSSYSNYWWKSFTDFPKSLLNLIKTVCADIAKSKSNFPYSIFHDPNTLFIKDGRLKLGPTSNGLTCATFVTSIIYSATKKQLLSFDNWPDEREGDLIWLDYLIKVYQKEIEKFKTHLDELIDQLNQPNNSNNIDLQSTIEKYQSYIDKYEKVIAELNEGTSQCFIRFRPEEVTGAAFIPFKNLPISFYSNNNSTIGAEELGKIVLQKIS